MRLIPIEDAFVNPRHIAAVTPDQGETLRGAELRAPDPNRCVLHLVGGSRIHVGKSASVLRNYIDELLALD